MNCSQVEERLEAWVDGDLSPPEARALEAHLDEHPSCAARAALARRLRDGLRELPEHDAPAELLAAIKAAGRVDRSGGEVVEGPWRRLRRPLALLAASLVAALGLATLAPRPAPGPAAAELRLQAEAEELRRALVVVAALTERAGEAAGSGLLRSAGPAVDGLRRAFEPPRRQPPGGPTIPIT